MSQTDQGPLSLDWCESAQQELAKLAQMFDLGEHRLDDDVATLVYLIAPGSLQLSPHLVPNRGIDRRSAFHSRLVIRRHIQINLFELFVVQADGAEVTSVSSSLFRQPSQILLYCDQSRHQLFRVIRGLHHARRDDD